MTNADLRVSDADRERTVERLRHGAGEGRLDDAELEERVSAAYAARTHGELERVAADLPAPPVPAPARTPVLRDEHFRQKLAGFIVVNAVCIAIWAATGADGSFWPVWVLLGTGIGLLSRLVHGALGVERRPGR